MKSKIRKLLFIGDITGANGYEALKLYLPRVVEKHDVDFVIVNGENRTMPYYVGLTSQEAYEILDLGVDVITLGNHVIASPCIKNAMQNGAPVIRPLNIPNIPGKGHIVIEKNDLKFLVINAIGHRYMSLNYAYNNVMFELEKFINNIDLEQFNCIFLDIHAECHIEKLMIAHYFHGRITAVIGTHTHLPTNDCRIIGRGTAYQSDVGMTGNYTTLKGKHFDWTLINKTMYWNVFSKNCFEKTPLSYNTKAKTMCSTLVYFDINNRKATTIKPIICGDTLFGSIK